jgi:methionine-rich copper-binding protein CopC
MSSFAVPPAAVPAEIPRRVPLQIVSSCAEPIIASPVARQRDGSCTFSGDSKSFYRARRLGKKLNDRPTTARGADAMTHISRSLLFFTAMVMACLPAEARTLHVRSSVPAGETIIDGRNMQYVIQFDGQLDHRTSSMEVISNGKVVEALVSLRGSEPSTLVASAPTLQPGRYQLHWRATSVPDGDVSEGLIAFTVGR